MKRILEIFAWTTLAASAAASAQEPVVRIGVVIDGPWERNVEIERIIQRELTELMQGEFEFRFPDEARIVGDWSVDTVETSLARLLGDPEVHVVLAMGVIASDRATRLRDIPKPLIAPFIIDAAIQGTPREGRGSGVRNLSYLSSSITLRRDLEAFRQLRPFERLVLLHGPALNEIPGVRSRLEEVVSEFDIELTLVEIRGRADEALSRIPEDAEAVYVNALLQLLDGELEKLAEGLVARRLPSFSRLGRSEVERGLLMSLTEDVFDRRARRVALNVQRALLGEDPATFGVDFVMREELVINMATARRINVFPSFALETVAELIQEEPKDRGRRLNLLQVAAEAVLLNRDLAAFDRRVAAGAQNIPIAKSSLLPQLSLGVAGQAIDADRASATGIAQYLLAPSLTLTQLIYSDPAWANKTIQEDLQEALERDRDGLRLDIVQAATTTYLDVMRTLTSERIQKDNLALARSNLELSKVRESIGASGRAEVYRWEAQLAADQAGVIRAATNRNLAEIALNRLLHRPLEEPFAPEEVGVDDPTFMYVRAQFYPYISSRQYFRDTRNALTAIALEESPELMALDAAIRAERRGATAADRAFYIPDVFFQANIEQQFRAGAGGLGAFQALSELFPDVDLTAPNNTNWSLGVDFSLPLFTSGQRPAIRRQSIEGLSQLRFQREAIRERIEQRVRSALHETGASYAGIELARDSAEASERNLDLVTDAYSQGAVSIIDLLDAQNAAVRTREAAANAVYDFLIDLLEVERALGKFYFLASPVEIEVLFERVDRFFLDRGKMPPSRLR